MNIRKYNGEDYLYCTTLNKYSINKKNVEVYIKVGEIGELYTLGEDYNPIPDVSVYNGYNFNLITYRFIKDEMVMDMFGDNLQFVNYCPLTNEMIPKKLRVCIKEAIIENNLERFV